MTLGVSIGEFCYVIMLKELLWEREMFLARHRKESPYIGPTPVDENGCLKLCTERNLKAELRLPGKVCCDGLAKPALAWPWLNSHVC